MRETYREPRAGRVVPRLAGLAVLGAMALLAGCRQDMQDEPKFVPQRGTTFFADNRSVRPQVQHTVARGQQNEADFFYTGLQDGKEVNALPFPATMAVLQRGQERYNIYCTPCHSRVGNGAGMIVQRGYKPAGNFHDARILAEPLSHYYYVISNGYGAMPDYAAQVTPVDRWAIAAYIRALQLSQNAKTADVPQGAQVEQLQAAAERQGLPASYAQPWEMPTSTSVYALPPNGTNPGMAPPMPVSNPSEKNRPLLELPNGDVLPPSNAHISSRIGRYGQKQEQAPTMNNAPTPATPPRK
ncbi:MAG: c-type cytochrome [Acidobacteriaceae bacterium]